MKYWKNVLTACIVAGLGLGLTACGEKESKEEKSIGSTLDDAAEAVGDAAEEGAEKAKTLVAGMEQKMCPVSGHDIDKESFIEYKGQKVYFCCDDCVATFKEKPAEFAKKLPQFGGKETPGVGEGS